MKFSDFSPPPSPSPDQQHDALRKGLGRAVQWAMTGRLVDEPLLEACLRDHRYDRQCEDSRGDWHWGMIKEMAAAERFRVPILHALYDLSDERSAGQLCELAFHYAASGDETFRARLYEIVEQKPFADRLDLGEDQIIRLDGESAFVFAARARGESLTTREWDWDDGCLVDDAVERFGEERVNDLLGNTTDRGLRTYRKAWARQKATEAAREAEPSSAEKTRAITACDILSAAESDETNKYLFRRWGIDADEADLRQVFRHLLVAREPTRIANLLRIFSKRAIPEFDRRLVEFCRHVDDNVRSRAYDALATIEHPLIREFALAELENGARDAKVVGLFVENYRHGDEHRILEAVELPEDDDERHGLLMDVDKVLESNPEADCSRLAVITYASNPCSNCRFHAARLLIRQDIAPGWLADECRFDCDVETRKLVEEHTGRSQDENHKS